MAQYEFYQNTGLLKIHATSEHTTNANGNPESLKGERGARLSDSARRRLFYKLLKIDWGEGIPVMTTHTYRQPPIVKEAKLHIREFIRRCTRNNDDCPACWRLEFQRRGAAHFHCVFPNHCYHWLKRNGNSEWCDITNDISASHKKHGFDLTVIRETDKRHVIAMYVGGHTAKANYQSFAPNGANVGRWWGISNPKWAIPSQGWIPSRIVREIAAGTGGAVRREYSAYGFSLWGEASQWAMLLMRGIPATMNLPVSPDAL